MISCTEKQKSTISYIPNSIDTQVEIPNTTIDKSLLHYNTQTSLWTLKEEIYSGYMVVLYPDSTLKEKTGILEGKKQNQAIRWFPDGHVQMVANYHNGKLHGDKKRWSSDSSHILISDFQYHLGKAHGEQTQWYSTGELYKRLNLNMGREEGLQRAFRKNGELYANYEAKDGRVFGLKKASLCYGLEEEKVKY